jgi:hypothetical protein
MATTPKPLKKSALAEEAKVPAAIARATRQKYEYTELSRVSLTISDTHNVYGVIVDASFPHKVSEDKFVCSLKVIDPSLNPKSLGAKSKETDCASVIIYGRRFEDLPIVSKLGDIVRIHRASLRMYNGQRQFNISTHWNGSWAVFSTEAESEHLPFMHSGKRATIEKHETQLITALRKWAVGYFAQNEATNFGQAISLSKARQAAKDFDVNVKILGIHEMDEYTNEVKVADKAGDFWYVLVLKLKFPDLHCGQVVRIRAVCYDPCSQHKQMLFLQHFSNIMSFMATSKTAKALALQVTDDWKSDKAELEKQVPMRAIQLSEVDSKWSNQPFTTLANLFHGPGSSQEERKES